MENEFLASMLEWERAPVLPISQWFEPELSLPRPETLDDAALHRLLWETIHTLYSKRIVLEFTEHLSDRQLYCVLIRDILPACEKKINLPKNYLHWHCLDDSDDPDTWLRYYASDEERTGWAEESGAMRCCWLSRRRTQRCHVAADRRGPCGPSTFPMNRSPARAARTFLTAQWRHLVLLNFEVDPELLRAYVPRGVKLDFHEGRTFASVVGFLFLDTRLLGAAIPFHRNFEELNLRIYVPRRTRRRAPRRGVRQRTGAASGSRLRRSLGVQRKLRLRPDAARDLRRVWRTPFRRHVRRTLRSPISGKRPEAGTSCGWTSAGRPGR